MTMSARTALRTNASGACLLRREPSTVPRKYNGARTAMIGIRFVSNPVPIATMESSANVAKNTQRMKLAGFVWPSAIPH
jgi:hypothetical protein